MARFSSRRLSADPYPFQAYWADGSRSGRYARDVGGWIGPTRYCAHEPRPGFDNDANPILVAFRAAHDSHGPGRRPLREFADAWALSLSRGAFRRHLIGEADAEHVAHARQVLARLAAG